MAKRVNKQFVVILGCVAGGLALAAGGGYLYMSRQHNAESYLQKAEAAEHAGRLLEARDYYGIAVRKQPSNGDLYMKLADVDERLAGQDQTFLGEARRVWAAAVEADPTYKPALNKLLDLYIEQVGGGSTDPDVFQELRRTAEMTVRADPNDLRAQVYSHAATLQQWLNGASFTNKAIDNDIAALALIAKQHPERDDAAYYLGMSQLRRARNYIADARPEKAIETYDQLADRLEGLIHSQPTNGALQLRSYQVLVNLFDQDRRPERAERYQADIATAIQAAANLKPQDELFDDSRHYYAQWLRSQRKDRKEVEKAYRDWMAARPSDQQARIELADYLSADPQTRPEALKILETPLPADPNAKGLAAMRVRGLARAALLELNTLRADDIRAMVRPEQRAQRDELLAKVDTDLARIIGYGFNEDYNYLKLRGKVEMLHNKPVEAVKTFERARTMSGGRFDTDLWVHLADAYLKTGQTGSAQHMMEDVAVRVPNYAPARILLAESYLGRKELDKADAQIRKIEELSAGNPQLAAEASRLRVALLSLQNQGGQAKEQIAKLPETTRAQRLTKGALSAEAGDNAEAVRLYQLVLKDNPADLGAVGELVNQYMHQDRRDLAQKVVADALTAKPNDPSLMAVRDGLNATTPQAVRKWQDELAEQVADPFSRAIRKAGVALDRREFDVAAQQLNAADHLRPDDVRTIELRYQWYLRQGKLADAAGLVEHAAKAAIDGQGGYAWRTRYALDRNDVDGALANARALVGAYGEFAGAHIMLGRAQQAAGQYADAIRSYDAALDRQADNIEAMRNKAACLDALGRFDEEKSVVDAAARVNPDNPVVRDMGLNYELNHGDPANVVTSCEALAKKEPDNATIQLALGQACTMAAQAKLRTDKPTANKYIARANEVLAAAMTRFADNPDMIQKFYAPRALAMQMAGDFDGAQKLLQQFIALPQQQGSPEGYRQLALLYEQANRPDLAEEAWRTAYAKSGKSVDSELELARFLQRRGRTDDALKLLDANASQPRIVSQRIDLLVLAGRLDQAKALVDQVLAKNSSDPSALFYRGLIELRQNDAVSAERDFSLFRDKDPQNVIARLWLSRAMRARDNVAGATTELEAALKTAPTRTDVRVALLDAYSFGDQPRWDAFDRTIAEAKADPRLNTDAVWSQINARGLAKRGQFDKALAEIQAARKLEPNSYALRQDYVNVLLESRNYKAVLDETEKSLAEGHREGLVFEQRGVAKSAMGDKVGALKEFDAALAIASAQHDADGVSNLLKTVRQFVGVEDALLRLDMCPRGAVHDQLEIDLRLGRQDYAGAIKAADSLLAQPNVTRAQRRIALQTKSEMYYALKRPEESRKAFDALLEMAPDDWMVLNNAAYLIAESLKQPEEARRYSGKAYQLVQRTGGNPTVADTHGWVLTLCGGRDARDGLSILEKLVASDDVFPKARYHLAEAYLRQNRPDNALDQLNLAKAQIADWESKKKQVDSDLKTSVEQALADIQKKKSQASSR